MDTLDHFVQRRLLEQISKSACFYGAIDIFLALTGGEDDETRSRHFLADRHYHLHSIHDRQSQFKQRNVRRMGEEFLHRFPPIGRLGNHAHVRSAVNQCCQSLTHHRMVVRDQHRVYLEKRRGRARRTMSHHLGSLHINLPSVPVPHFAAMSQRQVAKVAYKIGEVRTIAPAAMQMFGVTCDEVLGYLSAVLIASSKALSSNGLPRKATAPACAASSRTSGSSCADTNTIGSLLCSAARKRCNSNPFMPGSPISRMTHPISS